MKNYYNDYDFETFYADVNGTYFETDPGYIQVLDSCYDTYTGSSDDYNYSWNWSRKVQLERQIKQAKMV